LHTVNSIKEFCLIDNLLFTAFYNENKTVPQLLIDHQISNIDDKIHQCKHQKVNYKWIKKCQQIFRIQTLMTEDTATGRQCFDVHHAISNYQTRA